MWLSSYKNAINFDETMGRFFVAPSLMASIAGQRADSSFTSTVLSTSHSERSEESNAVFSPMPKVKGLSEPAEDTTISSKTLTIQRL